VPPTRDQQRNVLRLEGQVRRDGSVGREAAEGAGRGECPAEAAVGGVAARPGCVGGPSLAKVVTPAAKREAVAIPVEQHEIGVPPLKWSTNWGRFAPQIGGPGDGWEARET
jgi:hypothetical protein